MTFRSISMATGIVAAAALMMGCEGDKPADGGGKLGGAKTAKPAATAAATAKATATAAATAKAAAPAAEGKGILKGVVKFSGKAPEMKVPKAREKSEVCKDNKLAHNAVVVKDGKLADVFVGIDNGQIQGGAAPAKAAEFHQKDCVYSPRIAGIVAGQEVAVFNDDATLHNVNSAPSDAFSAAQPKGAPALKSTKFEDPGVFKLKCDVHPWMRAFIVASDNPYFSVSGADGSLKVEKVPAGKFKVVAWHSIFGKLEKADVEVKDGEVTVEFEYKGDEKEPAENAGELKDLF